MTTHLSLSPMTAETRHLGTFLSCRQLGTVLKGHCRSTAESASQNERPKRDLVSLEVLNGKMHPGIWPKSGMLFPKRTASGKRISPLSSKVGCAFRTGGSWQSGTTHLSLSPMSGTTHLSLSPMSVPND